MGAEGPCRGLQDRSIEAFLAHRELASADLAHAEACPECGRHCAELRQIAEALSGEPLPEPGPERVARVRARALEELARPVPAAWLAGAGRAVAPGFRRELVRILLWAAAPLPVAALGYALLFRLGGALLSALLPEAAVEAILFGVAAGTLSWLALIYGSIPLVAHHRALRRWREVTA